jgi:hypothetical protein
MTQEEKSLLLKDLCARLPYNCRVFYEYVDDLDNNIYGYSLTLNTWCIDQLNANKTVIKPYLRQMSSMTDEEKHDLLVTVVGNEGINYFQVLPDGSIDNTDEAIQDLNKFNIHWISFDKDTVTLYLDWLNKHYFDFHNLIEKGLAIAVTKENNPYK